MSKKILSVFMIMLSIAVVPVAMFADSQSYTPPPEKGTIYVIVRHKKSFPPMKTNVSIRWGSWSRSGKFDAAGWRYSREGFVIKLDHRKNDSVPLSVNTDGSIVRIYQGGPPSQKGDSLWEYAEW